MIGEIIIITVIIISAILVYVTFTLEAPEHKACDIGYGLCGMLSCWVIIASIIIAFAGMCITNGW